MKKITVLALFVFSLFSCGRVDPLEDLDVVLQKMNRANTPREMLAVLTIGNLARISTIEENAIKTYMSLPEEDYYLGGGNIEQLLGKLYVARDVLEQRPLEGYTIESDFVQGSASAFSAYVNATSTTAEYIDASRNRILRDISSADSAERIAEIFKYQNYNTGDVSSGGNYDNILLAEIAAFLCSSYIALDTDSKTVICNAVFSNKPYSPNRVGAKKLMNFFQEATALEIVNHFNWAYNITVMTAVLSLSNLETLGVSVAKRARYAALNPTDRDTVLTYLWDHGTCTDVAELKTVFSEALSQV
ncbi:MAG: hypothetical protein Ta2A_03440 [Treponemataceae bacterium]|nr:MAG: hypothetical protein Ta2A_03440 [Treponemataceae bacterium]